uniref:C-type lectin domain-containing protein n=1 Tax=Seriola lalandi dorsalis TaxID=1841481 RepID=A0A3B4XD26_SERLL
METSRLLSITQQRDAGVLAGDRAFNRNDAALGVLLDDQYVLVTEEKTWFEAQSYCRQHYTDLVSVRSPAENEEVRSRLQGNPAVQEAWIGLHRDSWKWSDGSGSSFRHWWESQPDNQNSTQACVHMQRGRWDDWRCATKFNFLCQSKGAYCRHAHLQVHGKHQTAREKLGAIYSFPCWSMPVPPFT